MLLIIKEQANSDQITQMAEDYDGYIKIVVDVKRSILTGGGEMHVDGKTFLLADGSKQEDLWGGGIDWETNRTNQERESTSFVYYESIASRRS